MGILSDLMVGLQRAWCAETAAPGTDGAGPGRPIGQCAVSALLMQDLFGGELLRAVIDGQSHYWNRIPGGGELDVTRGQYPDEVEIPRGVVVPRSRLLEGDRAAAARTVERYRLLCDRVG